MASGENDDSLTSQSVLRLEIAEDEENKIPSEPSRLVILLIPNLSLNCVPKQSWMPQHTRDSMDIKLHLGAPAVKISIKVLDILPSKLMYHHLRLQIGVQLLSVSDEHKTSHKRLSSDLSLMI